MRKTVFPYFGGKSLATELVWRSLGDVGSYVEPFAGSLAVLLNRPKNHKLGVAERHETIGDADAEVVNFWRAFNAQPGEIFKRVQARPSSDVDLMAWKGYRIKRYTALRDFLLANPHNYDLEAAEVWAWGQCIAMGAGWSRTNKSKPTPSTASGIRTSTTTESFIQSVSDRLSRVNLLVGSWSRTLRYAKTFANRNDQPIGVFLDPPYATSPDVYSVTGKHVNLLHRGLRKWAIDNGKSERYRIIVCGYEGEHHVLEKHGWSVVSWKAGGGYANAGKKRGENASRERMWMSPHCLQESKRKTLFSR